MSGAGYRFLQKPFCRGGLRIADRACGRMQPFDGGGRQRREAIGGAGIGSGRRIGDAQALALRAKRAFMPSQLAHTISHTERPASSHANRRACGSVQASITPWQK